MEEYGNIKTQLLFLENQRKYLEDQGLEDTKEFLKL